MHSELKIPRHLLLRIILTALGLVAVFLFALPPIAYAAGLSKPANNLGLVGYWAFNEGVGTQAGDGSGRGNHGILTGGPNWTSGKARQALNFDGTDDYVENTVGSLLQGIGTGDFAISLWAYIEDAGRDDLIVWKSSDGTDDISIFVDSSQKLATFFRIDSGGVQLTASTANVSTGTWVHVVVTRVSGTVRQYINTVEDGGGDASTRNLANHGTNRVWIGSNHTNFSPLADFNHKGKLDEVRVYSRALTATEVAALYNSGSARANASQTAVTSGLVGRWTFDGAHMTQNVADSSGTGNNGRLIGFTSTTTTMGRVGQGLQFAGGQRVEVLHNASIDFTDTESFALSLWFKTSVGCSGGNCKILVKRTGSNWYTIHLTNGVPLFEYNGGATIGGSGDHRDGQWHHMIVTVDRNTTTARTYVNGVLSGESTSFTANVSNSANLQFGQLSAGAEDYKGLLDDVRIYDRALTAAEVKQIYNEGAGTRVNSASTITQGGLVSGLVGHWSFDGADTGATIADKSGSGNDGYFRGSATSSAKTIGKVGQALQFNSGSSNFVSLASDFSEPSRLAVSLWFKTTSLTGGAMFGQADAFPPSNPTSFIPVLAVMTDGRLRGEFWTGAVASTTSAVSVADGQWHHAVMVGDATTQTLYLDGVSLGSRSGTINQTWWINSTIGTAFNAAGGTRAGLPNNWAYFNGTIDDVRVYNRALSAEEVKQLYNLGR